MKLPFLIILFSIFFSACASQNKKIIFIPDSDKNNLLEQTETIESWQIIESQNGQGEDGIPQWVYSWLNRDIQAIEDTDQHKEKYVFIKEGYGDNFLALQQWADWFSVMHEFPRLVALRSERRLITAAKLYPDDEYGNFYAVFIKKISDAEFSSGILEQSFWIKRKIVTLNLEEEDTENTGDAPQDIESEQFEYYMLVSIEKKILQNQLIKLMEDARKSTTATKNQATAIANIQNSFFDGF
ncbi:MAG: hypothetical protein FWH41_04505 [Treponema sp.]|nr:hypothetical protein [Treponema sp.]